MKDIINRNYLEIKSVNALIASIDPKEKDLTQIIKSDDFQVNKFFYKKIGLKHKWTDRLTWSDLDWIKYSSSQNIETYILKVKNDLAGYFELILHLDLQEIEIAYFGLLEEYRNKKLGGYLLTSAIKKSFGKKNIKRVWVHTCTLDHENALKNYLARGMKIFKNETIKI